MIGTSYESETMDQGKRIEDLIDALRWLAEMAGYSVEHLDPEWARKNGGDFRSAIDQANAALKD